LWMAIGCIVGGMGVRANIRQQQLQLQTYDYRPGAFGGPAGGCGLHLDAVRGST